MKKKIIAVICALAIVLGALATLLVVRAVRGNDPPELESVRERFEVLILGSAEVNEILFGEGLPTFPRVTEERKAHTVTYKGEEHIIYYYTYTDPEYGDIVAYWYYVRVPEEQSDGTKKYVYYDIQTGEMLGTDMEAYRFAQKTKEKRDGHTYYNEKTGYYYYELKDFEEPTFFYTSEDDADYDYCTYDCGYTSTDDIRRRAAQVYSSAYLTPIFEGLFTGVAFSEDGGVLVARYRDHVKEKTGYLQKSNKVKGYELAARQYDLSTMKILKKSETTGRKSTSKYVIISIESYVAGAKDKRETVELSFARENGIWYLDSPTY